MSQMEAGILFCISAVCLFAFGLTISGIIIDKWGVKNSLMFGLSLYAFAKFILIFAAFCSHIYYSLVK
jgi:MFS family permease